MYHSRRRKMGGGKRGMRGAGFMDWLRRAGSFIKSNKLVSRGLSALGSVLPAQYGVLAKSAGTVADKLGYGRRRRVKGGALSLAGGKRLKDSLRYLRAARGKY